MLKQVLAHLIAEEYGKAKRLWAIVVREKVREILD